MGLFKVRVQVADMAAATMTLGDKIELLVDTGATYTSLPHDLLVRHGVPKLGKIKVKLANGKWVTKETGNVILKVDGKLVGSTVLFCTGTDVPVLGATTLELASLAVDPVGKRLVPTIAIQAQATTPLDE